MGISKVDRLPQIKHPDLHFLQPGTRDSPRACIHGLDGAEVSGFCLAPRVSPASANEPLTQCSACSKRSWAQHKHHTMWGWAFGKMPIPVHRPAMSPKMSLDLLESIGLGNIARQCVPWINHHPQLVSAPRLLHGMHPMC